MKNSWLIVLSVSSLISFAYLIEPQIFAQENSSKEFSPDEIEFFEMRIRPILVEHCYECHNSHTQTEGGLVLDYRDGLLDGGDHGEAVDLSNANESLIIQSLRHQISGLEMPHSRPKLPEIVINDFRRWIDMGLPDPRTEPPSVEQLNAEISWSRILERRLVAWCYQPITRPPVPAVKQVHANPVDAFIGRELNEHGLKPGKRAPVEVLIRRLYLTLIGLPPTPDEVAKWTMALSDQDLHQREIFYEQLVDQLLASPHYGERWARHWMDWLRYAESHGSEGDPVIENAWMYRDYLIRALNQDVPYDTLLREHLAGDLMASPRLNDELGILESPIGTAHWRMVFHGFAPTDALDERVRFIDDQINVFSKAFLGLTVSCARCHDHKFDAIGQDDYYALFGVLASNRAGRHVINQSVEWPQQHQAMDEMKPSVQTAIAQHWLQDLEGLKDRIRNTVESQSQPTNQIDRLLSRLRGRFQEGLELGEAWRIENEKWNEARLVDLEESTDDAESVSAFYWNLADTETYRGWFRNGSGLPDQPGKAGQFAIAASGETALAGIYPAGPFSHTLSDKLAANLTSPDFTLHGEYDLWAQVIGDGNASIRYVVQDYPRDGTVYPIVRLDDNRWRWQRFDVAYWDGDQIHFELAHAKDAPLMGAHNERSWFGVRKVKLVPKGTPVPRELHESWGAVFEVSGSSQPGDWNDVVMLLHKAIEQAITDWISGRLNDGQAMLLDDALRSGWLENRLNALADAAPRVAAYREKEYQIPVATRVPGITEARIVDHPLFFRGDHHQPGETIPRRFLALLPGDPYPADRSGRLELANDLLRDENPLTRRVIVNRIWHHLFGRGLVATPDNFGLLGSEPTHPDLLDWLADEFSEELEWSLKKLVKRLVMSETWQQGSTPSAKVRQIDPDNRYWSHAMVRRLDAETIRDQLLTVSLSLDSKMFGAPVTNDQPRRSIYLAVHRNSLDPFLRVFDFPEPFSSVGKRDATNVPAQALAILNDPLVIESSIGLAQVLLESDSVSAAKDRIDYLFLVCLGRVPTMEEQAELQEFLQQSRADLAKTVDRAIELEGQLRQIEQQLKQLQTAGLKRCHQRQQQPLPQADLSNMDVGQLAIPVFAWDFDSGAAANLEGLELRSGARVQSSQLVVGNGGYAISSPIEREISEKTLEAWVVLDDLRQRGGGVISLQTLDGSVFDSVVFAEMEPGQWTAGSEFFNRTQTLAGPQEDSAADTMIHIAVAYHADGRIVAYRDGKLYGTAYQTSGPVKFPAGGAVVTLGLRHLPKSGNRSLSGKIGRANLYDRALSAEEIAASFANHSSLPSINQMLQKLTDAERKSWKQAIESRNRIVDQMKSLVPVSDVETDSWQQLVQAIFMAQEFIYLR